MKKAGSFTSCFFYFIRSSFLSLNRYSNYRFILRSPELPLLMSKISLRPATIADLPLLRYWDEQDHVITSDPHDDWEWETELIRNPPWRLQLIAELDNRPIGFVQIIDPAEEETHYWGNVSANQRAIDIWIGEAQELGKGYGTEMMRLAIVVCFKEASVKGILIDPLASNTKAHRFYERLGFRFVERKQFVQDLCFVYILDREVWEQSLNSKR